MEATKYTLIKVPDDAKLWGTSWCAQVQGCHSERLEECGDRDLMNSHKDKREVPHVGRNSPLQQYRLGSSSVAKDLGVLAGSKLSMGWQCVLVVNKASSILGCINMSMAPRWREVVITFYSAHARLYLDALVQFWVPQYLKDIDKLAISAGGHQDVWGLEHLLCEERLRKLSFLNWDKRRLCGDLKGGLHLPCTYRVYKGSRVRVLVMGHVER